MLGHHVADDGMYPTAARFGILAGNGLEPVLGVAPKGWESEPRIGWSLLWICRSVVRIGWWCQFPGSDALGGRQEALVCRPVCGLFVGYQPYLGGVRRFPSTSDGLWGFHRVG